MSQAEPRLTLRAATPEDQKFLLAVFASTRADELTALGDPALIESFVTMQFSAQQQSYQAAYPRAENSIICWGDRPVGRMVVDRTVDDIRLVEIALLGEFRGQGIGSRLLRGLMDEAAASRQPLMLSVYLFNPAIRLYERLGFSKVAEDGVYIQMRWADSTA